MNLILTYLIDLPRTHKHSDYFLFFIIFIFMFNLFLFYRYNAYLRFERHTR